MNIQLADRLVALRKEHKLSQEALAEKLGLSRQTISKWERAEASPDTDNLIALAGVYGVTLDELLGNEKTEEKSEPQPVKKEKVVTEKQKKGKKRLLRAPILLLLAIAVYVGGGMIFGPFWWALMWIVFPLVVGYTFAAASMCLENIRIVSILLSTLAALLFAVAIYIVCGVVFQLWAIAWIVFLAVPAYVYISVIKKK